MTTAHPDNELFFLLDIGWIAFINPYTILDLAPTATQDEVMIRIDAGLPDGVEASASAAILSLPARRLAWHMLERPTRVPHARDFASALWDPVKHWLVASHLLRDALIPDAPPDRWEVATDSWTRFARSPRAAKYLASTARTLGLSDPEATARTVLEAVEGQLLPGLHALFAVLTKKPHTRRYHRERMATGNGLLVTYAKRLVRDEQIGAARKLREDGRHVLAFNAYASVETTDSIEQGILSAEIGDLVDEVVATADSLDLGDARALASALENAATTFPFDPRPFAALFSLHMRCGFELISERSRFNEGGLHLAKAAVLEPTNEHPARLLAEARRLLQAAEIQIRSAQQDGHTLNEKGMSLRYEVMRGMREASELANSIEGRRLRTQRDECLGAALATRLGLDPSNEAARQGAWLVATTFLDDDARSVPFTTMREELVSVRPLLAAAPWDTLRAAFESGDQHSLDSLLAALPVPPIPDADGADAFFSAAERRLRDQRGPEGGDAERKFESPLIFPWLFSRVDLRAKVAAAAGVACFVAWGTPHGGVAWDGWRRDVAYGDLHAASEANRPDDVMKAARRFLAHAPKGHGDRRVAEVAHQYEDALWREMSRAAREKRDGDLMDLLADARALAAQEDNVQ